MFTQPGTSSNKIFFILIGVLAVGSIVFGALAIVAFGQAYTTRSTLSTQKQAAADAARADQKKLDEEAASLASESPYRSYTSPGEYGPFEIKFPKTWSASVVETRSSQTQVVLTLATSFLRTANGTADLAPAKVTLTQRTLDEYLTQFKNEKKVTSKDITVSGIAGKNLTGTFPDKRTVRQVVIPVRDKVIIFSTEDAGYNTEFEQILAQSKINP